MRHDMKLIYVTDLGVEVSIVSDIERISIHTKDGDYESRYTMTPDDAVELANMFAKASQHTRELNNKK